MSQIQPNPNPNNVHLQRASVVPAQTSQNQTTPAASSNSGTDAPSSSINHPPPPRVVICIPLKDPHHISTLWMQGFEKLRAQGPPGTTYLMGSKYGIAESREDLVNNALVLPPIAGIIGSHVTHIFFLDGDIIPLTDNVLNTMLSYNLPIVSGLYYNTLYTGVNAWVNHTPIPISQPQPLVQVDDIGFGCALIARSVFETLRNANEPLPWFHYAASLNKQQSEDFYFLAKCAKYNIKPVVDINIQCGHLRTMIMNVNGTATTV